jgi:cytochrome P450
MGTTVDGRLPPGPRGHLLLGSIPEIRRDNVHAFLDIWRRYGDTVRLRGPMTLYLVAHPDGVKHVLQDNAANYPRPPAVRDRLRAIVGEGLVGAEGAGWVRSRRMAQPAFRRHHVVDRLRREAGAAAQSREGIGRQRRQRMEPLADEAADQRGLRHPSSAARRPRASSRSSSILICRRFTATTPGARARRR